MSDTSVINLLVDAVVDHMTKGMSDLVNDPDTKIGLLRSGKLQDDPTINKLNILVREGGKDLPDILVPRNHNFSAPQYTLGGGEFWLRRFIAEYELFFFQSAITRDEARRRANVIFSRFRYLLKTIALGQTDTFGETAIAVQSLKLIAREGGGPPGSFIWRADHQFEFLTELSL